MKSEKHYYPNELNVVFQFLPGQSQINENKYQVAHGLATHFVAHWRNQLVIVVLSCALGRLVAQNPPISSLNILAQYARVQLDNNTMTLEKQAMSMRCKQLTRIGVVDPTKPLGDVVVGQEDASIKRVQSDEHEVGLVRMQDSKEKR